MSTHISSSNPLSRKAPSKQPLKLVPAPVREADPNSEMLVAGGLEASPEMQPGQYVAVCEGARPYPKFGKDTHQLLWQIDDGPHTGTGLIQYVTIERFKNRVPLSTPLWEAMQDRDGGRG